VNPLPLLIFCLSSLLSFADPIIVIDPGHGGKLEKNKSDGSQKGDGSSWNNATAAGIGHLEKDLALNYSQSIARALATSPRAQKLGAKAILTRNTDKHVSSMGRAAVAVENSARIFLSVHFNPHWEYMHFLNPYIERDRTFSDLVVKKVATALKPFGGNPAKAKTVGDSKTDGGHLKDGIRTLGFARQDTHLYQAVVMLLEVEFIDNPKVSKWLLGDENYVKARDAVAAAVVDAICDHLENDTPPTAPRKAR